MLYTILLYFRAAFEFNTLFNGTEPGKIKITRNYMFILIESIKYKCINYYKINEILFFRSRAIFSKTFRIKFRNYQNRENNKKSKMTVYSIRHETSLCKNGPKIVVSRSKKSSNSKFERTNTK